MDPVLLDLGFNRSGFLSYFGGPSEVTAARTVFLEIPNVLAINLIGNPSARCNLRISAQSSTDNNSFAPIGSIEPRVGRRGSTFGRRHGVSFQASPTCAARFRPPALPTAPVRPHAEERRRRLTPGGAL